MERQNQFRNPNKLNYGVIFAVNSKMVEETVGLSDIIAYNNAHRVDQVIREWKKMDEYSPNWSHINGASVLDIASGSLHSPSGYRFYPHFSRFAAINGANVIAIDQYKQSNYDQTLFRGIQKDLIPLILENKLHEIPELDGKTFDIIHSFSFVGSNPEPMFIRRLKENYRVSLTEFEIKLVQNCSPLLREGGIIDLDLIRDYKHFIHRKVNGELVEEKV